MWSKQQPLQRARSFFTALNSFCLDRPRPHPHEQPVPRRFYRVLLPGGGGLHQELRTPRSKSGFQAGRLAKYGRYGNSDSLQGRDPQKHNTRPHSDIPGRLVFPPASTNLREVVGNTLGGGPECVLVRHEAFLSLIRAMLLNNHLIPGNEELLICIKNIVPGTYIARACLVPVRE